MKAIVCQKYGSPESLKIIDVPIPIPSEDEILVKVKAAAINDYDWSYVRGRPLIYRLMFGLFKPKNPIPGMELSGVVETVGSDISTFKEGDEVYGDISESGFGALAEYVCVQEKSLRLKPKKMSFEEAASIPHAAMLAYQGLVDIGKIKAGQKVLINGAGGGMGTFGIQIAKLFDVEVVGVDSRHKLDLMRNLGYDDVIDYRVIDFTKMDQSYDLILDAKTTRPPRSYMRVLKSGGKYVTVGGYLNRIIQLFFVRIFGKKQMHIVALKTNRDLEFIEHHFNTNEIKPVIDGPYKLEEVPRMIREFGEGKHLEIHPTSRGNL